MLHQINTDWRGWIATFFLLQNSFHTSFSSNVYVTSNGNDVRICGSKTQPCRTIEFAFKNIAKSNDVITLANPKSRAYILTNTVSLSIQNITLVGHHGDFPAIIYSKTPKTIFELNSSVILSVSNIAFRGTGLCRYKSPSSPYLEKHSLIISINNSRFEESPVVVDISAKSPIGTSYITISQSSVVNCKKGIWIDASKHTADLFIHASDTLFQSITNSPFYVVISNTTHINMPQSRITIYSNPILNDTKKSVSKRNDSISNLVIPDFLPIGSLLSTSCCRVSVTIRNCLFKDIHIKSASGGVVYLHAKHGIKFKVVLKDTKFVRNEIANQGGAVCMDGRHNNVLDAFFDNVTFVDNVAGFSGGGIHIDAMSKNVINVTIRNSRFIRNKAQEYGAGISFQTDYENKILVVVEGTTFMGNNAGFAGMAISLIVTADRSPFNTIDWSLSKEHKKELKILNSSFTRNKCSFGGAVYLDNSELTSEGQCPQVSSTIQDILSFDVSIKTCVFNSNVAKHKGGAIYIGYSALPFFSLEIADSSLISNSAAAGGAIYVTNGKIEITNSKFLRNAAEHGGALNFKEGSTTITNTEFHNNTATTFGGAIYLRGEKFKHIFGTFFRRIENSVFTNTIENSTEAAMFYGLSDLEIINTTFELRDDGLFENQHSIYAFVHDSALQITSPFTVTCPANYKLLNKTIDMLNDDNQKDFDKFDYLAIKCVPCGKGTYSVKGSSYFWDSRAQSSLVLQINCMKCPAGGDCDNGHIVSLPNYWGYQQSSKIKFVNCPFGYCSSNSTTYNSCAENREGYLCGHCTQGHRLSLFSSFCVDEKRCQDNFAWLIIVIVIIVIIVIFVLFFVKEISSAAMKCSARIKKRFTKDKEEVEEEKDGPISGELIFSNIRLIFFFYQLQLFTKVPLKSTAASSVSPKLQHVLGTIFSMSFVESVNEAISICPSDQFNSVHKKLITVCLWILILFTCFVVYGFISCIRYLSDRYYFKINNITSRFQAIFIQLLILSYIPVSTSFFHLVHCVEIYDNGFRNVLYTQGNITCYATWQWFVVGFLSVWTAPFVVSIYVGISLLQKRVIKTKHFFMTLICPWSAVYFYFKLKRHSIHNASSEMRLTMRQFESSSSNVLDNGVLYTFDDVDGNNTVKICNRCSRIEADDITINNNDDESVHTHETPLHNESTNHQREEPTMDARGNINIKKLDVICEEVNRKDILEKLQGSFKYDYWLSVQKLRNIILIIVYTFNDNIVKRLYITGVVLLIFLIIHFKKRPYKEKVMNWLESSLQTMLIILDVMSIFDIMQFYGIPETDDIIGLRTVFRVVKIFIMLLPLPLLGLYMLVFRCKVRKLKTRES